MTNRKRRRRSCAPERARCGGGGGPSRWWRGLVSPLHHQEWRHGGRPFRQPLHHRESSGPPMGSAERWSGSHGFIFYSPATRGRDGGPHSWRHLAACCNGCAERDEESVMVGRSLVSVVDDDESVRESLPDLLRELGFAVQAFSSAEEFLASESAGNTRCLILDV